MIWYHKTPGRLPAPVRSRHFPGKHHLPGAHDSEFSCMAKHMFGPREASQYSKGYKYVIIPLARTIHSESRDVYLETGVYISISRWDCGEAS